jgi:hypothetical protein
MFITLTVSAAFFTDLAPSLTDSAASVTPLHASAVSSSFLACGFALIKLSFLRKKGYYMLPILHTKVIKKNDRS